jgi:beta-catenin-like protein 1
LLPLSQASTLSYPDIIRSGAINLLVGLLTHENMDIVIDVIELIYEFTDEDAELDQESEESERYHEVVNMLVTTLVSAWIRQLILIPIFS